MPDGTSKSAPLIEKVKGKVKEIAGRVSGDESLVREGALHQEKAEHLEDARRLDAEAAQSAEQADLDAREQELELEQERLANEEAADDRRARLEREQQAERFRIEHQTEARNAATENIEQAEKQAVARDEGQAAAELRQDRQQADDLAAAAERTRHRADVLDVDDLPEQSTK